MLFQMRQKFSILGFGHGDVKNQLEALSPLVMENFKVAVKRLYALF